MRGIHRFQPDFQIANLFAMPLAELKARGMRALLFDLDNTITGWRSMEITPQTAAWFQSLAEQSWIACILSNNHQARVAPVAERLQLPFICNAGKPARGGYWRACQLLGVEPRQTAMVGDQLLTDIWGGNRAGLLTIYVQRIDDREFWGTKLFSRRAERHLLKRLRQD